MQHVHTNASQTFLQRALWANVLFTTLSVIAFLAAPQSLSDWSGIRPTAVFPLLAVGLIGFGLFVAWVASRPQIDASMVKTIIGADIVWVVGSAIYLLIAWSVLSANGRWLVGGIAEVVLTLAICQSLGLRRLT